MNGSISELLSLPSIVFTPLVSAILHHLLAMLHSRGDIATLDLGNLDGDHGPAPVRFCEWVKYESLTADHISVNTIDITPLPDIAPLTVLCG